LTASLAAVESLKRREPGTASTCLSVALPFAELLTPLFQALKSMSPEHFLRFRDATGDASAVQSRTYQLMQIALTGVNPDTIKVIVGIDELADLGLYNQPLFTSLAHLATSARTETTGQSPSLDGRLEALSKELLKWRKTHRGIARIYLADVPDETGGTSGPAYLKHTVDDTISGAAEALRADSPPRASPLAGHPWEESLWPEEQSIVRRLGHAQPVLASSN
jgi:tryptophan 2,3-dioxygenase